MQENLPYIHEMKWNLFQILFQFKVHVFVNPVNSEQ